MACEDVRVPDPFDYSSQEWLRSDGTVSAHQPIRFAPGSENRPGITNTADTRDGIFFLENQIGFSIDGLTKLLIGLNGIAIKAGIYQGLITHNNTSNQVYSLPNESGEILVAHYSDEDDPTEDNDQTEGYRVGSIWINKSTGQMFIATSVDTGAAEWASPEGGGGDSAASVLELENENASTILKCQPVYLSNSGMVDLALADTNNLQTAQVIGLVKDISINSGDTGAIQTGGELSATTLQWDVVTGDTGGLVPNRLYWVSTTEPGKLNKFSPKTYRDPLCMVGQAISATKLAVNIEFLGRR